MTGALTVKQYIFGYNYNHAGGNAPAFLFDKPGSYYTGIGANGETDTIYFSAATISNGEASWVTSYKQKWKFNGTIYQENNAVIHAGNIGSQSVSYATSSGNADTVDSQHFSYSNDSNSPTYLWATNSNGSSFLAARGSISVNYANSAGTATTLYTNNTAQDASLCYNESPGLHFYRFNGTGNDIGGGDGFILQWSWNPGSVGGQIYLDDNPSKIAAIRGYDSNSKTFTSWSKFIHSTNYTDYVNTTNFPGLNKVGTVTSVTVTGANGLSGTGTITLSNAGVRSTTINGNYLRVNTNGTNTDLTIPYATNSDTVDGYHFSDLESRYVNVTGDTMSGRLNIGVESSGNANPLCLYHSNIEATAVKGKSVGIRLGHVANSYYARIAAIFESQNPDYLRPGLAFYTMDSTYQENTESERMRISAAGNVGIGTTTPGYKLDVNGTTYLRNDTIIGNKSKFYQRGTRGAVHYEIVGDDADYGVMKIRHTSTEGSGSPGSYTATLTIQDERANTISGSYEPTFYIKRTGATYVPDLVGVNNSVGRVFTITPYGNIFTGNRSIDNTAFTNSITIFANQSNEGSNQTFDTSKSSWGITFKRQWSSNEQNSTSAGIYAVGMSNWRTGLAFRVKNNTTGTNGTHDTTSMWMAPNGNIGIGTTNPSSYKLEVNGDTYSTGYVRATSGFVKGSSSNDYVLLGGGGHKAISDFSMAHSHPYLPLAGGYMDQGSHVVFPGTSTDTNYGGSIEFREVNYVTTSQTDWSYAPGITFHWGGYTVGKLGLRSDGNLAWRNQSIIHSGNIGSQSVNYANSAGTSSNSDKLDNIDSTGFLAWTGMSASGGSSAPFQTSVDFFNNTANLNAGARMIYNCPGSEYTILYTRRSDDVGHGSILRWGYPDNYIRMIRMISGSPQTSDWEKISAGYADSAGSVAWSGITGKPSSFTPSSHSHDYLPLAGGTMTGAINLSNTNAKLAFGSLTTSPVTGYKAPSLQSNGVGIYSRYGGSSNEGAIIITEDTCVIYNSADTGWNFQVMDKDLGTDMTNDATRSFGVNQNHQAWSLAGFVKSGSSDSYVLLGGGGHKALSDFSMSHSHPYLPLSGGTCTGNIYAPAFYESSDERLKDFYNSIDVDLDKLSLLPKKFFKWKSNPNGEFEIGTSAQELQKIYPQLVNTDDKGYLTVAYDKLSIIALRAIDKLYEMNKNLERRIQILESKL